MENKIIGSHNTMSYLNPNKWYTRLFKCFSRCQKLPLTKQLEKVDCIDLRVFNNNGIWCFAHGLAEYNYKCSRSINALLLVVQHYKPNCIVRLILEKVKNNKEKDFNKFKDLCIELENEYPNFIFIGGVYKKDWTLIHKFKTDTNPKINQFVSSMQNDARWYEKFIPILYAKRMNKINKNNINKDINLFDFLEIDL